MKLIAFLIFIVLTVLLNAAFWPPAWYEFLLILAGCFAIAGLVYGLMTSDFTIHIHKPNEEDK